MSDVTVAEEEAPDTTWDEAQIEAAEEWLFNYNPGCAWPDANYGEIACGVLTAANKAKPFSVRPEVLMLFARFVRLNPQMGLDSALLGRVLDAYGTTIPVSERNG